MTFPDFQLEINWIIFQQYEVHCSLLLMNNVLLKIEERDKKN